MSESNPELAQVDPVLDDRTKRTLGDVRWLLVLVVGGLVTVTTGGWAAYAQVQSAARDAAKAEVAGLGTEQAALKSNVSDLRAEVADVKSEVRELRKDLRALFPRLPAMDAGADGGR